MDTIQIEQWSGAFGDDYVGRNLYTPEKLDRFYRAQFGVSRTEMNEEFLRDVPKDARILEVGCGAGNQLWLLQRMGYTDLTGVDTNAGAVAAALGRTVGIAVVVGSAAALPFAGGSFDLVFTSGVLIHIAPDDLPAAMREIRRCARIRIWGLEYYAPDHVEVPYRDRRSLLWRGDFARLYADTCPYLAVERERTYPYLGSPNIDSMFMLRAPLG